MKTNTEKDEKICRVCKRILVGESKTGVCPDCLSKYGSPLAALGFVGTVSLLGGLVKKNSGKLVKGVIDVIKLIKS